MYIYEHVCALFKYMCPLNLFEYLKNDIYMKFFDSPAFSSTYSFSLSLLIIIFCILTKSDLQSLIFNPSKSLIYPLWAFIYLT